MSEKIKTSSQDPETLKKDPELSIDDLNQHYQLGNISSDEYNLRMAAQAELEHQKHQDEPLVEGLADQANAVNKLRSDVKAKIKQLRIQYEIDKRNGNVDIPFEQVLAENAEINAAKEAIKAAEDQIQDGLIKAENEPFMTKRIVNELIDMTDKGPATYQERDKHARLDIMLHVHQMANEVDNDIANIEEKLKADPGIDRNIIEGAYKNIIDKILAHNKEIDDLLGGIYDAKLRRIVAEQAQHMINERIQKANRVTGNQTEPVNKEQFIDRDDEVRSEIVSRFHEFADQFDSGFEKAKNILTEEQDGDLQDVNTIIKMLVNVTNAAREDLLELSNGITDEKKRLVMIQHVEDIIKSRRKAIERVVEIYNKKAQEVNSEKEADEELNKVVSDPNADDGKKQNALRNWFNKHPKIKKLLSLVTIGLLSMNMLSGIKDDNNQERSWTVNHIAHTQEYNDNKEADDKKEESDLESVSTYADLLNSNDYEKYTKGGSIEFNRDLESDLNSRLNTKYDIFPGLSENMPLLKAAYVSPEVIASLATNGVSGFELQYVDSEGNRRVATSNEEINVAIEQMKNDKQLFGDNYGAFKDIIDGAAKVYKVNVDKGTPNAYKYFNKQTGRWELAIGLGDGGEATVYELNNGVKIIYVDACSNCVVVGVSKDDVFVVKPPGEDPGDEDTDNPGDKDTDKSGDKDTDNPGDKDTDDPKLEKKDPTVDINVNKDINEQIKMGNQRVDNGGYRAPELYTESSLNEEVDLYKTIEETQAVINAETEKMNEQYKQTMSQEELNTLQENQTGQNEVQKPHSEATKDAETINGQVENDENDGIVSPI